MIDIADLYAAAARTGLLSTAVFGGDEVKVDFRAPDTEVLGGLGLSADYTIRYPSSAMLLESGHEVVIDGVTYHVREARDIGDGSETRATLTRVS